MPLLDEILKPEHVMLYTLLPREEYVVEKAMARVNIKWKEEYISKDWFVDISKSSKLCTACAEAVPCLLPNSKVFRVRTNEILKAEAHMILQGLTSRDWPAIGPLAQSPRGRVLLKDMSGNGMSLPAVLAYLLVALATTWIHMHIY